MPPAGHHALPPGHHRAQVAAVIEEEDGDPFTSDFAREMMAGVAEAATPVFKSDFASLIHSSYREQEQVRHLQKCGNSSFNTFGFRMKRMKRGLRSRRRRRRLCTKTFL